MAQRPRREAATERVPLVKPGPTSNKNSQKTKPSTNALPRKWTTAKSKEKIVNPSDRELDRLSDDFAFPQDDVDYKGYEPPNGHPFPSKVEPPKEKVDEVTIDMTFLEEEVELTGRLTRPQLPYVNSAGIDKLKALIRLQFFKNPNKALEVMPYRVEALAQQAKYEVSSVADVELIREIANLEYREHAPFFSTYSYYIFRLKSILRKFLKPLLYIVLLLLFIIVNCIGLHYFGWRFLFFEIVVCLAAYVVLAIEPPKIVKIAEIQDHCVGPTPCIEISGKYKIMAGTDMVCFAKKYKVGFSTNLSQIWIPRSCVHNEINAYVTRQVTPSVGDSDRRSYLFKAAVKIFVQHFKLPTYEADLENTQFSNFLHDSTYTTGRKKQLTNTYNKYSTDKEVKFFVKAFCKIEVNAPKEIGNRNPRFVSGPGDVYIVAVGPTYKRMWDLKCKTSWKDPILSLDTGFVYTGKMDPGEIGLIVYHFECLGWYCIESDYKRFDGHQECESLEAEFDIYELYNFLPPHIIKLLRLQLDTKGQTRHNVSFKHKGKRASGVPNTTGGNCITNMLLHCAILASNFNLLPVKDYVLLVCGDDCLLFMKEKINFDSFTTAMTEYGHDIKSVMRTPLEYDFITYCSARACDIGNGRLMVPMIGRMPAKSFICTKPLPKNVTLLMHCQEIATGMLYYHWLPVLGSIVNQLARTDLYKHYMDDNPYKVMLRSPVDVDIEAVDDWFEKVYGISSTVVREYCDSIDWSQMGVGHLSYIFDVINRVDGSYNSLCGDQLHA